MLPIKCNNPECFSYNKTRLNFCNECAAILVNRWGIEELYDLFYDADKAFADIINTEENEEEKSTALMCRAELYTVINKLMLLKIKREGQDVNWPY